MKSPLYLCESNNETINRCPNISMSNISRLFDFSIFTIFIQWISFIYLNCAFLCVHTKWQDISCAIPAVYICAIACIETNKETQRHTKIQFKNRIISERNSVGYFWITYIFYLKSGPNKRLSFGWLLEDKWKNKPNIAAPWPNIKPKIINPKIFVCSTEYSMKNVLRSTTVPLLSNCFYLVLQFSTNASIICWISQYLFPYL